MGPSIDAASAECQFREAAKARGLKLPLKILADGKIHRCDTDDGGNGDASYLLHLDGIPAGGFQNWRDGIAWQDWRADIGRALTQTEKKEAEDRNKTAQRDPEA